MGDEIKYCAKCKQKIERKIMHLSDNKIYCSGCAWPRVKELLDWENRPIWRKFLDFIYGKKEKGSV